MRSETTVFTRSEATVITRSEATVITRSEAILVTGPEATEVTRSEATVMCHFGPQGVPTRILDPFIYFAATVNIPGRRFEP